MPYLLIIQGNILHGKILAEQTFVISEDTDIDATQVNEFLDEKIQGLFRLHERF